jgi:hypothetical protein
LGSDWVVGQFGDSDELAESLGHMGQPVPVGLGAVDGERRRNDGYTLDFFAQTMRTTTVLVFEVLPAPSPPTITTFFVFPVKRPTASSGEGSLSVIV